LILTNLRMIFVPATPVPQFSSFSLPLGLLSSDSILSKPFIGDHYITGTIKPIPGGGLPAAAKWKITLAKESTSFHAVFPHPSFDD
jgi:hypothetical protein